jgi:hypothetical protein
VGVMALLTANAALQGSDLRDVPQLLQELLPIISSVAAAFLIVSAIHADAPAGIRHEWLTRPVPRLAVLAAKTVFVSVALLIPLIAGEMIAGMRDGRPWQEIVLVVTTLPMDGVVVVLALCVVAVMTATLLEATAIIIVVIGVAQLCVPFVMRMSGTGEELYMTGAAWIADRPRGLFAMCMGAVIIWSMYAQRRTRLALGLFAMTAILLILSPLVAPWPTVFAIQRSLRSDPAADGVVVAADGVCLPAVVVNPPAGDAARSDDDPAWSVAGQPARLSPRQWTESQRRAAGANAIGFETRTTVSGAPVGWRTIVERVDAHYVDAQGQTLHPLRPARFTPTLQAVDSSTLLVSHYWLVPRETGERLEQTAPRLSVDYSLSLLRPVQTAELVVNSPRQPVDGFGYCGARFDRATSTISVDCFKRGAQPAQLTANLFGASPDTERASNYPDYRPVALELMKGQRHVVLLQNVPEDRALRVQLTSYEPAAHFTRSLTLDGVLGARADACPLPQ